MYVATHNIWDNTNALKIGKLIDKHSVLCGLQEFNENPKNDEYEDLMQGLGPYWHLVNESVNVPIAYDEGFFKPAEPMACPPGFQNRGVLRLHEGNHFTPPRYLSWAIFQLKRQPQLPPVAVVNFHLQHRAWNGKERNPEKLAIRRDFWYKGYEQSQWVVVNLLKHGLTTIWMGDYNRRKPQVPVAAPRQFHVAGDGIDQIYMARGYSMGATKFVTYPEREKQIATPSDHPLIVGNVQFLKP